MVHKVYRSISIVSQLKREPLVFELLWFIKEHFAKKEPLKRLEKV